MLQQIELRHTAHQQHACRSHILVNPSASCLSDRCHPVHLCSLLGLEAMSACCNGIGTQALDVSADLYIPGSVCQAGSNHHNTPFHG